MTQRQGLKDLVGKTGFSISTISRVLSGKSSISQPTKQKILDAARDMGFDMSKYSGSTALDCIAFVVYYQRRTEFENPFFLHSIRGAYTCAREHGYSLQIHFKEDDQPDLIGSIADAKSARGIILSAVMADESDIAVLQKRNFPFSVIGRPTRSDSTYWVDNDNYNACYSIVTDLLNRGMRNVAFVTKGLDRHYARDRFDGYRQAFAIRGISAPDHLIIDGYAPEQNERLQRVLQQGDIDVIIADDDETALTIANLVPANGKRIKVIGFNYMPVPHIENVDLWLVDIKPEELGYWSAKMLIQAIEKQSSPVNRLIPLDLTDSI
ncbi:MAG TPA: substrate-binding domain-containing protein [Spirochaetia bacterium]|nr:substrate-binding domain-containing protein [Spirochaetia bacterium]